MQTIYEWSYHLMKTAIGDKLPPIFDEEKIIGLCVERFLAENIDLDGWRIIDFSDWDDEYCCIHFYNSQLKYFVNFVVVNGCAYPESKNGGYSVQQNTVRNSFFTKHDLDKEGDEPFFSLRKKEYQSAGKPFNILVTAFTIPIAAGHYYDSGDFPLRLNLIQDIMGKCRGLFDDENVIEKVAEILRHEAETVTDSNGAKLVDEICYQVCTDSKSLDLARQRRHVSIDIAEEIIYMHWHFKWPMDEQECGRLAEKKMVNSISVSPENITFEHFPVLCREVASAEHPEYEYYVTDDPGYLYSFQAHGEL